MQQVVRHCHISRQVRRTFFATATNMQEKPGNDVYVSFFYLCCIIVLFFSGLLFVLCEKILIFNWISCICCTENLELEYFC